MAVVARDPELRGHLLRLLRTLGLGPHAYASAEEFLTAMPLASCIVTDVDLPGMSGFEFLEALRASGRSEPVVMLAEEADIPLAVAAMRAGASDFIEKPHMDAVLVRRIVQLVGHTLA